MNELGKSISQYRRKNGISQERLSEDSNINLRTLQRIEKGETNPHGDTLLRLSKAIGIPLEDLVSHGYEENYGYIKIMHISTLIFLVFPLGNILLPLALWLPKKDKIIHLTYFAKKLLNFQITWYIIIAIPFIYILLDRILPIDLPFPKRIENLSFVIFYGYTFLLTILNIFYIIIVTIVLKDSKRNYFPIAFKFLK